MSKLLNKFYFVYVPVNTLLFSVLMFLIVGSQSILINVFSLIVTMVSLLITDKIVKTFFVE